MMEDFLRIVTDFNSEEVHSDSISSEILEIAKAVNARGGVFNKRQRSMTK